MIPLGILCHKLSQQNILTWTINQRQLRKLKT
jgi:hypothetical protein